MPPRLSLIHDDGNPEITVLVHGIKFSACDYNWNALMQEIHHAEIRGAVYLLCWNGKALDLDALASCDLRKVDAAINAGRYLAQTLGKLRDARHRPVTLIGHSQGTLVIASTLTWMLERTRQIERVILMGGVVVANRAYWEDLSPAVRKEIINVYSTSDLVLRGVPYPIGRNAIGSRYTRKIRDIECTLGHSAYWRNFPDVLHWAWPTRRRSQGYYAKVNCWCPWEGRRLVVPANTDVVCPNCKVTFQYRVMDRSYYWNTEPKEIACSFCDSGTHIVQESARHQCNNCGRWSDFERDGNRVWILNAPNSHTVMGDSYGPHS